MNDLSLHITMDTVIQLTGYIIVAVALYFGVKIDLALSRARAEEAKARADEAHDLAGDAHSKLYDHVSNHPSH